MEFIEEYRNISTPITRQKYPNLFVTKAFANNKKSN